MRLASVSDNIVRIICFPKMEKRLFLFTPCKESGFSKFLFVESGIREIFASGMRNPGLWNPEYSSRNPESPKDGIPESK